MLQQLQAPQCDSDDVNVWGDRITTTIVVAVAAAVRRGSSRKKWLAIGGSIFRHGTNGATTGISSQ